MKIKQLKINSFGKLKDKEITLKDNINILFGKNEAGKSTIIKYFDSNRVHKGPTGMNRS